MAFTHLHVHTEYSLLDGMSRLSEIAEAAKALGMDSLAITDHGVMYGVIGFYKACKKAGIKPIIGCEIYVAPGSRFDREPGQSEDRYYHLVLLAENDTGYHNLMKIVSRGFVDGFYYRPRVDYEVLRTYHEGIICLSACLAGEVQKNLARGFYEEGKKAALRYRDIFGDGNFFLELQDHGIPEQKTVNMSLLRLSQETGIPLVATNDVHYIYEKDAEAHDLLLCIQTGKKVQDEDRLRYEGGQYYLKSEAEMRELFPYAQEALDNTAKIAERCCVEIEFGVQKLPKFDVPAGYTSEEYLEKLCAEGFARRYPDADADLKARLRYELDTIRRMGYVDYFLIVWDFIKYAKDHGISVGPGRGSAAGSIVAYALDITTIDPIRYQLLFERFLNPERVSMPDIDVDFEFERRQEVIDYVVEKYGKDQVVQIVTFGTMAARGVLRDVGRVMDLPYAYCDNVAKMVPAELNITITAALEKNPELRTLYETDPQARRLIDMSLRLEGLPRHTSMHAAGVVISRMAVDEYVPLSRGGDGAVTTQYTMTELEELGLLKMDFLGLRTLTVVREAAEEASRHAGRRIDPDSLDYADPKVFEYISSGRTEGVFQLESAGMKSFMKELRPGSLEDVIAGISLYRPGPMDFIPRYLKGKNDPASIRYDCPQLEPILKPTYGCIVYQEQVMQIVRDLAGYTLGRSDLVRRAMSKKKADVMARERQNFVYGNPEEHVKGCLENGIPEATANLIYDEMTDFAKYAFNKSHAACYAVVAYQTAWLKYYYPKEFMAALMTSFLENISKVSEYIQVCRQMGIPILPPDVNEGEAGFTASEKGIHYGLCAIKGIGRGVADAIRAEREENGPYRDLKDFIYRLSNREVNRRTLENFIKAGAMDCLPGTRKEKILAAPELLDRKNRENKTVITGQMTLFDLAGEEEKASFEDALPQAGEFDKAQLLAFEKEVLDFYLSGHPLEMDEEKIKKNVTAVSRDFEEDEEGRPRLTDGAEAVIGGIIAEKRLKSTKNNQMMAFLTIEDMVGTVEVLVFPRDYEACGAMLQPEERVFIRGRVSLEEGAKGKLIFGQAVRFADVPREVWLKFPDKQAYFAAAERIENAVRLSDGKDQVVIYVEEGRQVKRLPASQTVCIDEALLADFTAIAGQNNVKVVEKSIEFPAVKRYNRNDTIRR